MTKGELSLQFLRAFCAADIEKLRGLLTDDLVFEGPFHRSQSRDAYLRTLEQGPPEGSTFELIKLFEDGDDVCLFYRYSKTNVSTVIVQWNQFRKDKIATIRLIFDGRAFG